LHLSTQTVTLIVTDAYNNESSCIAEVAVVDTTAPLVTTTTGALHVTLECDDTEGLINAFGTYP